MKDIVIIAIIALIVCLAGLYVYKAKKSGKKCIGCPSGGNCSACNGGAGCTCPSASDK